MNPKELAIKERFWLLAVAAIIAVLTGLLWGGLAALFVTRRASMVLGALITVAVFFTITLAQGAHE